MRSLIIVCVLSLLAIIDTLIPAIAQDSKPADTVSSGQFFPWNAIGAVVGERLQGKALAVSQAGDGALLHCAFQQIDGHATATGFWLNSTTCNPPSEGFRLAATCLTRMSRGLPAGMGEQNEQLLCPTGTVQVARSVARWERSGVTEEYSVSVDGVRQDFIIGHRLPGAGLLQLGLTLTDAQAEAAGDGVTIVPNGSLRELAYNRLLATDATGRELAVKMEVVSAHHLDVQVDDEGAVYPVRIDPTFSDANWISLGSYPGANTSVFAMVADPGAGVLYIGGGFSVVGSALVNGVAKWDGTNWTSVGNGLPGGLVRALAVDGNGNLYAAGAFTNSALMITNVAKWDGNSWSGLGTGMRGTIYAVAADASGNVFVGGTFTNSSISAYNLAQWNGSSWSGMGVFNNTVYALAEDGYGDLIVGGNFTTPTDYAAFWDGSTWYAMGGLGLTALVRSLAVDSNGGVYAGGTFLQADGNTVNRIAYWNGSWSAVGSGLSGTPTALALDGSGNLYACGSFTLAGGNPANHVAEWNGSSWSALGAGIGTSLVTSLAVAPDGNLFAGGTFNSAGTIGVNDLAKWDGNAWSAVGSGPNAVVYSTAVDPAGNLYIGGGFTSVGGIMASNVAEWNGTNWLALGSGVYGNYPTVYTLATDTAGNLYAGGEFTAAGGVTVNNIAKWNGSSWSALGSGSGGGANPYVFGMIADNAGNLYAGGFFTTMGGVTVNGVAKWNGATWSALGTGISGANANPDAFAFDHTGNLYVGGSFTTAGGLPVNSIAKWNGSTWSALGSGLGTNGTYVSSMVMDSKDHLYVGGQFTNAGSVAASYVAEWDGNNWSPLGSGMNNYVNSLAFDPLKNLYAGGSFTSAGGVSAAGAAKWDGTAWSALASGLNNVVVSLASDASGRLYMGGAFTVAGTNVSAYVAQANVLNLISKPHRNADGSLTFNLLTTPNTTNQVQVAISLAAPTVWQSIFTNVAPANGAWQFTDTNTASSPVRFYRSSMF